MYYMPDSVLATIKKAEVKVANAGMQITNASKSAIDFTARLGSSIRGNINKSKIKIQSN